MVGTTTIYVTHDQVEAMTMGTRIAVLDKGKLQQVGTPLEVYQKPTNLFVAEFIGSPKMNIIHGKLFADNGDDFFISDLLNIKVPIKNTKALTKGTGLILGIRPKDLTYTPRGAEDGLCFRGKVSVVEVLGDHKIVHIECAGDKIVIEEDILFNIPADEQIEVKINPEKIHLFDAGSMQRI